MGIPLTFKKFWKWFDTIYVFKNNDDVALTYADIEICASEHPKRLTLLSLLEFLIITKECGVEFKNGDGCDEFNDSDGVKKLYKKYNNEVNFKKQYTFLNITSDPEAGEPISELDWVDHCELDKEQLGAVFGEPRHREGDTETTVEWMFDCRVVEALNAEPHHACNFYIYDIIDDDTKEINMEIAWDKVYRTANTAFVEYINSAKHTIKEHKSDIPSSSSSSAPVVPVVPVKSQSSSSKHTIKEYKSDIPSSSSSSIQETPVVPVKSQSSSSKHIEKEYKKQSTSSIQETPVVPVKSHNVSNETPVSRKGKEQVRQIKSKRVEVPYEYSDDIVSQLVRKLSGLSDNGISATYPADFEVPNAFDTRNSIIRSQYDEFDLDINEVDTSFTLE